MHTRIRVAGGSDAKTLSMRGVVWISCITLTAAFWAGVAFAALRLV